MAPIDGGIDAPLSTRRDPRSDHAPLAEESVSDGFAGHDLYVRVPRVGRNTRKGVIQVLSGAFQHLKKSATAYQKHACQTVPSVVAIKGGLEAPVSRANVARLRQAGWLRQT